MLKLKTINITYIKFHHNLNCKDYCTLSWWTLFSKKKGFAISREAFAHTAHLLNVSLFPFYNYKCQM